VQVRGEVRQRDVDDEYVHHTHHARQGERRENDAWMPVLVLSGCGCSPSHSSARRNQDHAAAQVAGLVAFVNRRGSVRSSRSLMSNRGSPASIMAPISATARNPGTLYGLRASRIVSERAVWWCCARISPGAPADGEEAESGATSIS